MVMREVSGTHVATLRAAVNEPMLQNRFKKISMAFRTCLQALDKFNCNCK